jgi:hypothetical protein
MEVEYVCSAWGGGGVVAEGDDSAASGASVPVSAMFYTFNMLDPHLAEQGKSAQEL